jgi:predicted glycosyltransferase
MHILIDINHPGQVHLWKHAARQWETRGHEVLVIGREKDVTVALLQAYGLRYVPGSTRKSGLINLAVELLHKTALLIGISRQFKPNVFLSVGSPAAAWASALVRVPHIVFTDTEHSVEQYALYAPFTDVIYTPSCFTRDLGRKQRRYDGYHELAYLHPNWFTPDPAILAELGLKMGESFFIVRFVSWEATHDLGQRGFDDAEKAHLIEELLQHGRVILSSEAQALPVLLGCNASVPPTQIHNLLHYATMYIGEGGTMATEAAVLGTPSIFVNTLSGGNWDELEHRYQLLVDLRDSRTAIERVRELLIMDDLKETWRARRERLLADKIDVTQFIVTAVEQIGERGANY